MVSDAIGELRSRRGLYESVGRAIMGSDATPHIEFVVLALTMRYLEMGYVECEPVLRTPPIR